MMFTKSHAAWVRKIANIENAIEKMKAKILGLTFREQIEAHESYLIHLKKELVKSREAYARWKSDVD